MKKYAVRSDMEGLSGVTRWEQVIPGGPVYEESRKILRAELEALVLGLRQGGAGYIEIYDEHYFGYNVDAFSLPAGSGVICGKPPYLEGWAGGVDESFSGLILQGYHAMAGVEAGILSHTYEPDIEAIWINEKLVGEIGVEAAVAGEKGVPLVLLIGDEHGAQEARELVPGVETVVVKHGKSLHRGLCRNWPEIRAEILEKSEKLAGQKSKTKPLVFAGPVEMRVKLKAAPYRERLGIKFPEIVQGEMAVLTGSSVSAMWARYWACKDETLSELS